MHRNLFAECSVSALLSNENANFTHAIGCGIVDINHNRFTFQRCHATRRHVFANGGDFGSDRVGDGFATHVCSGQRGGIVYTHCCIGNAAHSGVGDTGPFRGRKRSIYEGGVRVPGILEWPGGIGTQGRVVNAPAVTSDYLPTILAATGIAFPSERTLDGENLMPVLKDGERKGPIGFLYGGKAAWMERNWKLVKGGRKGGWELFDLAKDRGEQKNLAAAHPERVERMRGAYAAWKTSVDASAKGQDYEE